MQSIDEALYRRIVNTNKSFNSIFSVIMCFKVDFNSPIKFGTIAGEHSSFTLFRQPKTK
jgi:hypothetical protein